MGDRNGIIHAVVLGCGMMGQEHASYMIANPNVKLKYIVDTSDESIKAFMKVVAGKQTPLRIAEDELENHIHDIDLLVIATPNFLHTPALLRWGTFPITILVEKPVAVNLEQVQAIRKVKSQGGFQANIWVAMEYRYIPAIQKLIQMIPRVGPLKAVTIRENRYPFLNKVDEWNKDRNKSGDTLVEKCCHFFDLFRLLTRQEMSSCSTKIQRGLLKNYGYDMSRDIPIIDSAYVLLDFEGVDEDEEGEGAVIAATDSTDSEHSAVPLRSGSPALYDRSLYAQETHLRVSLQSDLNMDSVASAFSTEPIAIPEGRSGDGSRYPNGSGTYTYDPSSNGPTASSSLANSYSGVPVSPAQYEESVYEGENRDDLGSPGSEAVNAHPLQQWQAWQTEQQRNRQRLTSYESVDSHDVGPRDRERSVYDQEGEQAHSGDSPDDEAIHALSALSVSRNAPGEEEPALRSGLSDVPALRLQQATIGCLELCMFAEGSRHQEEIVVTGMRGRLEAYLPENKVFYYRRPDDSAWPDKSKPPPIGSIKEEIFDCSDLRNVYDFADEVAQHAGYHYCSTAIEWKYLVDAILAARPLASGGRNGEFVPHVSLEDGLIAVEMGIRAMSNVHNPVADERSSKMKISAPSSPGWGQLYKKQMIKKKSSADLLDRPLT